MTAPVTFGILCCGSYYSPWTPYTLASIYGVCDRIVVVNAGFDLRDPKVEKNDVPLERVSKDVKWLDVEGRVIEVKDVSRLKRKYPVTSQKEANRLGLKEWYDLRGRNMTLASEVAYYEGATMVLRIDSDQVCYWDVLGLRGRREALILYQYEFQGDVFHLAEPGPSSPWNDSVYYYRIHPDDWYVGGLAPVIHADRQESRDYHCAHLRQANPIGLSHEESYRHFRDRFLFREWTNQYGEFTPELFEKVDEMARDALSRVGKATDLFPPEVTVGDPFKYVEETSRFREYRWTEKSSTGSSR